MLISHRSGICLEMNGIFSRYSSKDIYMIPTTRDEDSDMFKNALDQLPFYTLLTDRQGAILYANHFSRNLFSISENPGLTLEELGIFHYPGEEGFNKFLFGNTAFTFRCKLLEEGVYMYTFSEVEKSEETLITLNTQMRLALKGANAGLFIADFENGKTEWDERSAEIFGFEGKLQINEQDLIALVHPEDRSKLREAELNKNHSNNIDNTFRIINKKGQLRYINELAYVLRDQEGKAKKLIGVNIDVTVKTKTEVELKASEERYRFLSESLPQVIWRATPDGALDYINGNGLRLAGESNEKLYSDGWISLVHKDDLKRVQKDWAAAIANKTDYFSDQRMRVSDGSYHWFSVSASPKVDEAGNLLFWVGVCVDNQKAKENEQRLDLAIESANQGIYDWNLVTDRITVNPIFLRITGYDPGQLPDKATPLFEKFIHPDDLPVILELYRVFQSGEVGHQEFEFRGLTRNSGYRWMRGNSKVVEYNGEGKPLRVIGTLMDVDKRKRLELNLSASNVQLKNIIGNVPGAVFRTNLADPEAMDFLNDQIQAITGFKASEFHPEGPLKFYRLIQESDLEVLKKTIVDAARSNEVFEVTYRIKDKSGQEKWIWEKAGFVTLGTERYIEGIMTDITDKVQAEDRIIAATIEAEDAERRRISKDIHDGVQQTLVSSMLSLQTLEEQILACGNHKIISEYRKGMKMLQAGVDQTRFIANSIMPVTIQEFGLIHTLESILILLNNRHSIDFTLYENLNDNRMNYQIETSLYRICQESIKNILNYSEASEVQIQLIRHKGQVVLSIEDNGKGFDMKKNNILYTGLGISYMKSRASSISASFDISSHPGKGTSIVVEVPVEGF